MLVWCVFAQVEISLKVQKDTEIILNLSEGGIWTGLQKVNIIFEDSSESISGERLSVNKCMKAGNLTVYLRNCEWLSWLIVEN